MKTWMLISVLVLGFMGLASTAIAVDSTGWVGSDPFDQYPSDALPPEWTAAQTGNGKADWMVVKDQSSPSAPHVLMQKGTVDFAVCLRKNTAMQDGSVQVKFKTLSGQADQVGGVIWRAKDSQNYYVCRLQSLRNNLSFYKMVNGNRSPLKKSDGTDAVIQTPVNKQQWQTLRIEFSGQKFTAFVDKKQVLQVEDATFSDPGQAGLWTKADSVTVFDDFVVSQKVSSQIPQSTHIVNFDSFQEKSQLSGWLTEVTGQGQSVWTVEKHPDAPSPPHILKQSAELERPYFPICTSQDSNLRDGFVEVKFKPVSGKIDQAAGVIWRYIDKDNYYICRANALEDNVVLYKVEKGKRTSIDIVGRSGGYGVEAPVPPAIWNTLRVEFRGSRFTAILNGSKLFEVQDTTFERAGKIGLWTKADSVMLFDDFQYSPSSQETKR